jgi:hypothetical protein
MEQGESIAQANLLTSLFACDKVADHTFRFACNPPKTGADESSDCPTPNSISALVIRVHSVGSSQGALSRTSRTIDRHSWALQIQH